MTSYETSIPASLAAANAYPIGIDFDVRFDNFLVEISTLPDHRLQFSIPEGPYARRETVKIDTTVIRPGLFLVSWVEASGATVVHVEDFANGILHSHATLPDGTLLRMHAPIRVVRSRARA